MHFDPSDLDDTRVVAHTFWQDLDDFEFEDRSGVYLFVSRDRQVKYVGRAGAGRLHEEVGDALRRGKGFGASLVRALYTNSTVRAQTLEADLISKYDPPNNLVLGSTRTWK